MSEQFTVKSFARGVTLTTNHVWDPAQTMATAMAEANIVGQATNAPFKMNWCFTPEAAAFAATDKTASPPIEARIVLPMIFPPPQEEFNTLSKRYQYSPTMTEMSVSFDQRANPYAITDESAHLSGTTGGTPAGTVAGGLLTNADLSRYDMTLKLIEKVPTVFDNNGNSSTFVEILTLDFPGDALFGAAQFNPYVVDGLNINLNPYRVYYWTMGVKGLQDSTNVATVAFLAMPSFNMVCTFQYPLFARDYSASATDQQADPYIQNIPTKTLGQKQTRILNLPVPAANAIITGDDVQGAMHTLEVPILDKLRAGYGSSPGSEADTYPWEQLANDTGYQVINVPMFANWWNVIGSDIYSGGVPAPRGCGFPYTQQPGAPDNPAAFLGVVSDQRVISIPEGFVVHHIIACQNTFPYRSATFNGGAGWAYPPGEALALSDPLDQKVGVAMFSGLRADDQKFQQVGYLEWTPSTLAANQIDRLKLDNVHTNMLLLNVPLVWNVARPGYSYTSTGKPVFLGAGNSTTEARTKIADMPAAFGGSGFFRPDTGGGETLLVVRWTMQNNNAPNGIGGQFNNETRTGWGGHNVIIIGKQSTLGRDAGPNNSASNGTTGQW